jgi:uncharacterized protein (TIGR02246 family)
LGKIETAIANAVAVFCVSDGLIYPPYRSNYIREGWGTLKWWNLQWLFQQPSRGFRMKFLLAALLFGLMETAMGQANSDEDAVRKIVADEDTAWNAGDAVEYAKHFADDGSATTIRGEFYTGHEEFIKRHAGIFGSIFKNTTLKQEIVSVRFLKPDVAMVETLAMVGGIKAPPPGMPVDASGVLRTRLLQVMTHNGGEWKIVAYHNVAVPPSKP